MLTDQICQVLLHENPLSARFTDKALLGKLKVQVEGMLAVSQYAYRQLLLSAGQPVEHIYFVHKGFARGFYYDEHSGKQITLFLWDESNIVAAASSFFLKKPSDIYIEVMPGSVLYSLSQRQVDELFKAYPATEILGHALTLQYKAFHKERTLSFLTRSAWERYLDLLRSHPRIEQKVSKDVIASYLGITPQSLSRLLKEYGHP